jgi:hypothetical protein
MLYIFCLVRVFHLEKRLTVLDVELLQHRPCPKHIGVHCDVATKDLGDYPPLLETSV